MPGIFYHSDRDGAHNPTVGEALIGRRTWIRPGDLLLLTTLTDRAGSGGPRVARPLYGNDLTNGTRSGGFLGVALYEIRTDVNGKVITPPLQDVTRIGPEVIYALPALEYSQNEPVSGHVRIYYARWCSDNRFRIRIASSETLLNTDVGQRYRMAASIAAHALDDPTPITYNVIKAGTGTDFAYVITQRILEKPTDTGNGQQWAVVEPLDARDQLALGDTATN